MDTNHQLHIYTKNFTFTLNRLSGGGGSEEGVQ